MQPVFDDLRAFFYSRGSTAYAVVFSLERLADPTCATTARAELVSHLNGISAHVGLEPPPPILLVGTRRGSLTRAQFLEVDRELQAALKAACPAFKAAVRPPADGAELCCFAIENTDGFAKDATIRALASAVRETVCTLPALKQRVPLKWLSLYDELQQLKRDGLPTQRFADVCAIARRCGLPHASHDLGLEAEVEMALRYFHSVGTVMWFAEPALRDLVALELQWVIDALSCVVRNFGLHELPQDRTARRELENEWEALTTRSRARLPLLRLLWGGERFAPHFEQLLHLLVRFSLGVPLRGSTDLEMLLPPLLRLAGSAARAPVDHLGAPKTALCTLVFMLESDARAHQLLWSSDRAELSRGYLPESTANQLWAALLSWSLHTSVGFEPSVTPSQIYVAFGGHRLLLERSQGQPSVHVSIEGSVQPTALERLRLLLNDVLAKSPHLRCSVLLPLPGCPGALVAYAPLTELSVSQGADVLGRHLSSTELKRRLSPWLPRGSLASYELFFSYRWGPYDSALTERLFDCCNSSARADGSGQLAVFLDRRRLQDGDPLHASFMKAMASSRAPLRGSNRPAAAHALDGFPRRPRALPLSACACHPPPAPFACCCACLSRGIGRLVSLRRGHRADRVGGGAPANGEPDGRLAVR